MTWQPVFKSPLGFVETKKAKHLRELRKEAADGSRKALRGLWEVGYVVIKLGDKTVNLREKFGDLKKGA